MPGPAQFNAASLRNIYWMVVFLWCVWMRRTKTINKCTTSTPIFRRIYLRIHEYSNYIYITDINSIYSLCKAPRQYEEEKNSFCAIRAMLEFKPLTSTKSSKSTNQPLNRSLGSACVDIFRCILQRKSIGKKLVFFITTKIRIQWNDWF